MEPQEQVSDSSSSTSAIRYQVHVDSSLSGLLERHQQELESLTLTTQPLKTIKFFSLAVIQCLQQPIFCIFARRGWLLFLSVLAGGIGILIASVAGPREEHIRELLRYFQFVLWWLALGVASSIGLV